MAYIQKESIKSYFRNALLSPVDITYCAVMVLIVLGVALLPTFLSQYNLLGARDVLTTDIGSWFNTVLVRIDSLSFTNTVVTFLFWCIVGIFVYAIVNGLTHIVENVERERELFSNEYVHPLAASRHDMWREKIFVSVFSFFSLALLIALIAVNIFVLLPTTTIHLRAVVASQTSLQDIFVATAAALLLWLGSCLCLVAYRLWRRHKLLVLPFEQGTE